MVGLRFLNNLLLSFLDGNPTNDRGFWIVNRDLRGFPARPRALFTGRRAQVGK